MIGACISRKRTAMSLFIAFLFPHTNMISGHHIDSRSLASIISHSDVDCPYPCTGRNASVLYPSLLQLQLRMQCSFFYLSRCGRSRIIHARAPLAPVDIYFWKT
ncbi:hypothetical protein K440DRAFT_160151 [Wilcoxina mikolae CBS 423.85]|nr:hypothetical protein K440DRAFT_160151 [Wilcoxina mikolae CBS 423.85]